jgi:hypothetical protein
MAEWGDLADLKEVLACAYGTTAPVELYELRGLAHGSSLLCKSAAPRHLAPVSLLSRGAITNLTHISGFGILQCTK